MNDNFDELAKGLAQSVTRRAALKKFGAGLAGLALAALGLANDAQAKRPHCLPSGAFCGHNNQCCSRVCAGAGLDGTCL